MGACCAPQKAVLAPVNIFKVLVSPGDHVEEGQLILILEAMKMETEVRAKRAWGRPSAVKAKPSATPCPLGDTLLTIG